MFFQSTFIIFLQRSSLVVAGQRLVGARFAYPAGTVVDLEVVDQQQLVNAVQQFFQDNKLKGKHVMLVLDYSIVFEKIIELDKTGQPDILLQGFIDAMPFDAGKRVCFGVEDDAKLHLYATNAALYGAIVEALHLAGAGTIMAVTPIAAYNLPEGERTVAAAIAHITKDRSVSKRANFHDATPS